MKICECGAQLVVSDKGTNEAEQVRLEAHLLGKQHIGYEKIRETFKRWKEVREDCYTSKKILKEL